MRVPRASFRFFTTRIDFGGLDRKCPAMERGLSERTGNPVMDGKTKNGRREGLLRAGRLDHSLIAGEVISRSG